MINNQDPLASRDEACLPSWSFSLFLGVLQLRRGRCWEARTYQSAPIAKLALRRFASWCLPVSECALAVRLGCLRAPFCDSTHPYLVYPKTAGASPVQLSLAALRPERHPLAFAFLFW